MKPGANQSWFDFSASRGSFAVYSFTGLEEVSKTFEFSIELVSSSANEDTIGLLNDEACLSITDKSGSRRFVHGMIREMRQLHSTNHRTHYRCLLVPRLWYLDKIRDHRIFQHKSVPDIIKQILTERGFSREHFKFSLFFTYQPREYCVQYGETYLHFISRLCEEEGIYFCFEHSQSNHRVCFCDREGGPKISGESSVRFFSGSGQAPDTAVISHVAYTFQAGSNAAAYKEWSPAKPRLDLGVVSFAPEVPVPKGMKLEQYQFTHLFQLQSEGKRYVNLQTGRQSSFTERIEAVSDIGRFAPGFTFSIFEHTNISVNKGWWVFSVRHQGEQQYILHEEAPDSRGLSYSARLVAIPELTRFVPQVVHLKNRVKGKQTAIVTGPEGEEIHTDEQSRVKVKFHWDRTFKRDEKTTCWLRVSESWAGALYGALAIPRIGQEVIVSFMEGDPDRPVITGRVYNSLTMPAYALPDNKTRTLIKSMSTPGEMDAPRGFNEFRIEDKAGAEEIFGHGQKNVRLFVKNDWKERILHDRHGKIGNRSTLETGGVTNITLEQDRKTELFSNDNLTVEDHSHTETKGKMLGYAGQEFTVEAGQDIVIEAGIELTVQAGGSAIKIDPSGVRFTGNDVNLGASGSPGGGSSAEPLRPITKPRAQG